MCRLDRRLVAHMGCHLRAQTATCVMDTFGISINSWVKMREDYTVRRALAERLIMRLDASGLLPASIGDDGDMTCRCSRRQRLPSPAARLRRCSHVGFPRPWTPPSRPE